MPRYTSDILDVISNILELIGNKIFTDYNAIYFCFLYFGPFLPRCHILDLWISTEPCFCYFTPVYNPISSPFPDIYFYPLLLFAFPFYNMNEDDWVLLNTAKRYILVEFEEIPKNVRLRRNVCNNFHFMYDTILSNPLHRCSESFYLLFFSHFALGDYRLMCSPL